MSQTVITAAFEQWKAQEAAGGKPVVLDGFVLANVPDLDPSKPISNTEGMPPDAQIVYRQDVDKVGVVNNNAVVYSITMGSNVGTFDFNWIGLVNKASGTVAMIVHAPVQRKLKTEDGQQGNAINRSFLMEYDGAATETQINTPAQTWQIDFTARLAGMDEELRLANVDVYGAGAFFGNGYLVTKSGTQYAVTAGSGYVGGIRTTLASAQNITVATKPAKVWLDVSWQGTLTGQWHAITAISVSATELKDHTDANGFAHYVFAVASIDASGAIKDLRPQGSLAHQLADSALPVYPDPLTVDLNTLGTVSKVGVYCQPQNAGATDEHHYPENLAGTLLVTPSAYGCQQEYTTYSTRQKFVRGLTGAWNGKDGPWSDWASPPAYGWGMGPQHRDDAYSNIAQVFRINGTSSNTPGNGVYGGASFPCDGGPSTAYLVIQNNGRAFFGYSGLQKDGITWTEAYTEKNKPYGLGDTPVVADKNNLTSYCPSGFYSGTVNNPINGKEFIGISVKKADEQFVLSAKDGRFYGYTMKDSVWTGWAEFFTNKNPPTAADMNALPLSGGTMLAEIKSTSANILRGIQGGYGQIIRMDANGLYFLQTNANDPNGNYNGNRSLTINNATGEVSIGTPLSLGSTNAIYKAGTFSYSDAGVNYNQTSGMVMQGVGDQVGEIYFLENIGKYAATCMHTHSGGRDGWFEFRNDGDIYANGTNVAPVGVIEAWPSDVPPTGWLLCDGSGFNKSIFPNLSRVFPSGQLPDLRGAFLRGKDNGKGVDPNRGLLSIQLGQAPASAIGGRGWADYAGRDTGHTSESGSDNSYNYHVLQETEQQRETRPYNVAINYIVRAA